MGLSEWGDLLQGIGSIGQAGAIGFGAYYATKSFQGWRQQNVEARRIEQAERILTAAYDVKTALLAIRNSIHKPDEVIVAHLGVSRGPDHTRDEDSITSRIVRNRLERNLLPFDKLNECRAMGRALFGEKIEKAISDLCSQSETIKSAAEGLMAKYHQEGMKEKLREVVNSGPELSLDNELNDQMVRSIETLEAVCLPVLRHDEPRSKP